MYVYMCRSIIIPIQMLLAYTSLTEICVINIFITKLIITMLSDSVRTQLKYYNSTSVNTFTKKTICICDPLYENHAYNAKIEF